MGAAMVGKLAAALLAAALLAPASALAVEADGYDVQVSSDSEAAYIDGASFAVDDFSRAQKGAVREAEGLGEVYSYYQGASDDAAIALAFGDRVIAYVPPSAHALCDVQDETSCEQLKAYFCALDARAVNGGVVLSADAAWEFTSEREVRLDGALISFGVQIGEGKRYVCISPADGVRPTHADMVRVVLPDAVDRAPEATGLAAVGSFLAGIDLSPLWVTLKTTGAAIVLIFALGLAAAYFTLRMPERAQGVFDTIFTIPMVLPPTVCGFILLWCLGRNTAVGQWFIDIGFPLIFSWPATVIAATVVAFPLMYRSCRGAFENLDANMLDAARTLFLAGNYAGITRTIPIAIYFEWMGGNTEAAWFWTGVILAFSFVVILIVNLLGRRTTRYRRPGSVAGGGAPVVPRPGSSEAEGSPAR